MQAIKSSGSMFPAMPNQVNIQPASIRIYRRIQWFIHSAALLFTDAFMMGAAFFIAYVVRFELSLSIFNLEVNPLSSDYQYIAFGFIITWMFIFALRGLYQRKNVLSGTKEYSLIFSSTSIGTFLAVMVGFFIPNFLIVARGWLLVSWASAFLLITFGRFVLRQMIFFFRKRGFYLSPAIVVGANDEGKLLATQLLQSVSSGFHILGFVDKKFPAGTRVMQNLYCLGSVDELSELINQHQVEEVILASSAFSTRDNMLDIFKKYGIDRDVNIRFSSGLYEIITTGLTVDEVAYVPLVGINPVRLTGLDKAFKYLVDYGLTIPGLLIISPFLFLLGLAVKLDSPGPVIFRRRVYGVNGRQFNAFKFRTMHVNGDEILSEHPELKAELEKNHKLKDDPRVTRVGKFIRKLSLDELPQLFNVLKGDMSLVGPRMITPAEIENYKQWNINLLTVRPGITGLWQVSGRSDITYAERVQLDMYYIRNWSIWLDVELILRTIPAVFRGHGAY